MSFPGTSARLLCCWNGLHTLAVAVVAFPEFVFLLVSLPMDRTVSDLSNNPEDMSPVSYCHLSLPVVVKHLDCYFCYDHYQEDYVPIASPSHSTKSKPVKKMSAKGNKLLTVARVTKGSFFLNDKWFGGTCQPWFSSSAASEPTSLLSSSWQRSGCHGFSCGTDIPGSDKRRPVLAVSVSGARTPRRR